MVLLHEGPLGVDKDSGLIHSVATMSAHVSDGVVAGELLHGEVDCRIAMGAGKRRC